MVDVDKAVIARLHKSGATFEVLVDCDLALEFKHGKQIDFSDVLASQQIFSDSKKGMLASDTQLKALFGSDDVIAIASEIIRKGDVQLTAEHRNKLISQKKKSMVDYIHINAVDPKTHLPHPSTRIERAFEEAKIHVDEFKTMEQQIEGVITKLRPILPLKFERIEFQIKIHATHAAKAYAKVRTYGKVLKEDWLNDGSLLVVLEIPAGIQTDVMDSLNKATQGSVECTVLKRLER